MPDDEVTPAGDPIEVPATTEHTDESGNTVVTGYPSGGTTVYEGQPGTSPSEGVGSGGTGEGEGT